MNAMCHTLRAGARCLTGWLLIGWLLGGQALASDVPRVVVSIKPLHSVLAGLMQGVGEPLLLIDGSTPPWDFQPDAVQLESIRRADFVIWSGAELEPGLQSTLESSSLSGTVHTVLDGEQLKVLPARHDDALRDPFYWLDSRNMMILLDTFAEMLSAADPAHARAYERNWQRMSQQLAQIDRVMEFSYRDVSGAPVFFYHDTHQYFEQAYAMHVAGSVVQISGGEIANAARLLATRAAIQALDKTCLFSEKGLTEPHLDLLLEDANTTLVELDSLAAGLPPGADLYVDMMRSNFAAISACVKGLKSEAGEVSGTPALQVPDPTQSPERFTPRYLLTDQYGRTVSQEDFRGRLQLIYFGYTFCPDICPTSLVVMSQALQLLGDDADQVQPIFITVDPQRDTREILAGYVEYFHPGMLGLSGSLEATKRTAELFRSRYEVVPSQSGDPTRYAMDHTASLYLLGRYGEYITKFAHGLPPAEVAARLREYLRE